MPIVSTGQITITDVNDGVGLVINQTASGFRYTDGVAMPSEQWIGFVAQRQGPISGNVAWYTSNNAALITDASQVSALSMALGLYGAEDGSACFMHISQVTSDEPVTITALVGEVSATAQVVRLHRSTAAAGATRNVYRGVWAWGTQYAIGDAVMDQGYGWACLADTASVPPPTYPATSNSNWTLAAVKGEDAKVVYLTASSQTLKIDQAGAASPASITLTANGQNAAGSPTYAVTSGTAVLTGSGTTRALAASSMTTDQVVVTVTWDGKSDAVTLSKIREGSSALTVIVSNEAHTLPSDSAGAVSSYAGSGTTVQVFEGSTALSASTSATVSAFRVGAVTQSPAATLTVGALTHSGTTVTVAQHSAMVNGTSLVALTLPITVYRADGTSVAINKVQTLAKSLAGATGATGAQGIAGLNFSEAKLLYTDPTFQSGSNGLQVYNNSGGGTVTHTRIAKLTDSPFADSGFNIEIANTGTASPGIGGFISAITSRASAVFVQRIVAKVPVGYSLEQATNAIGDGATNTWITSKAGTGKFEEYLLVRRCGATGSFGYSGHIYAIGPAGAPGAPVLWWLAYAAVYDFTALGFSTVTALLSNESHTVPTDSAGNGGNFTGAATTMTVFNGAVDDSANWTVAATPSNVTGSLAGKTYTVTAMSADTGFVDLVASRGGFSNITKRFTLTKSKAGVLGATGAQGPAVVVTPNRAATFTATDGTLDGSQADIVFTAAVSGVASPTYAWTFSGLQTNPTASTTATQTITAAQFGTATSATATCTVSGSFTDRVTVVRLERSTAAAGANQTFVDANGKIQGVSSGAGTTVSNALVFPLLAGAGSSLVPDYALSDVSLWASYNSGMELSASNFVTVTDGKVGPRVFRRSDVTKTSCWNYSATTVPLVAGRSYIGEFWGRSAAGTAGSWFLTVQYLKADGTVNSPDSTGYGYAGVTAPGTAWTLISSTTVFSVAWVAARLAAGTVAIRPGFALAHNYTLPAGGWAEAQGFRFMDNSVELATTAANAAISDIASDSKLTADEKREIRRAWDVAINEKNGLNTEAARYTLAATANTTYNGAIQALGTYLNGGAAYTLSTSVPPSWINDASLSVTTDIVGTSLRNNWRDFFTSRTALVNKLTEEAGKVATWGGVSGTGRPLNNAGQVLDTRNVNGAPNTYGVGNHREFKLCSVVGITTASTYCVVETIKGWNDNSGGEAVQWAYVTSGEVWKRSAGASATAWNAWVRDLDRALYTGDLAATNNAVGQGLLSARPTGTDGDFYYATDNATVYQKIAGAWVLSSNNTSVDANGNLTGVSSGSGTNVANNQDSIIRNPVGGVFTTSTATLTGRLKIKSPQLWSNTMMRFTVEIFEYASGFMCTLEVGGYNYSLGYWVNCTARVIGGSNVEYPVYFGRDATSACIWIGGATTETWAYPQVRIRDWFGGHSNSSRAQWETGWAISFDQTAITSVTPPLTANTYNVLIADTLPGADWAKTSGVGKPANNATKNTVTSSGTAPASPTEGDLWQNTATKEWNVYSAGAWRSQELSAGRVTTGTLQAGTMISAGTGTAQVVLDGHATQPNIRVIDSSGAERARMGLQADTVNGATAGFVALSPSGVKLFDSRLAVGIVGNTLYDNYNVGDETTNPNWDGSAHGVRNIAIGDGALNLDSAVVVGGQRNDNIAVGPNAGRRAGSLAGEDSSQNIFVGVDAAYAVSGGAVRYRSVALGYRAAYLSGRFYDSVAIGSNAGSGSSLFESVAIGSSAGKNFTLPLGVVAVGTRALGGAATQSSMVDGVVAIGWSALGQFQPSFGYGYNTVAVGQSANESSFDADNTTAIGAYTVANKDNSTALGASSAATGANATAVGASASATASGATALGYGAQALVTNSVDIASGGTSRAYFNGSFWTFSGNSVKVAASRTPASSTAAGTAGEICWDANYVYVCVSTNTWKRSAINTW